MSTTGSLSLSDHQIFFAAAATKEYRSGNDLKRQADADGYSSSIQVVRWTKLVTRKILEKHPDENMFRRGSKWYEFFEEYGDYATGKGIDGLEAFEVVRKLFSLPLTDKGEGNIIHFPTR